MEGLSEAIQQLEVVEGIVEELHVRVEELEVERDGWKRSAELMTDRASLYRVKLVELLEERLDGEVRSELEEFLRGMG